MKNYFKNLFQNPLEVTLKRNIQQEKKYGSIESFIRSVFLPVESKKALKDLFIDLVLIFIPIITFGVVMMTVVSGSMYPTIHTGDMLIASNIYYGGKFTATPFNKWYHSNLSLLSLAKPKKGDIVAFRSPIDDEKIFVKRILAEPGETIQFKNGVFYINDKPVKLEFISSNYLLEEKGEKSGPFLKFKETLPNGISYEVIFKSHSVSHCNTPKYLVPKDCYFLIGDNRDNSADSRSILSFVESKYISGRVICVFFHHQYGILGTIFGNPIAWIKGFRLSRTFINLRGY